MKILIAGTGGVGGYFGGRMAAAGLNVDFLARGENLRALQKNGLRLLSKDQDWHGAVSAFAKIPANKTYDLIFICVKSFQTEAVLPMLKSGVGPETLLISLQNGLERHLPLVRQFGAEKIALGLCYLGAHLEEPGVIRHVASGHFTLGTEAGKKPQPQLKKAFDLFQEAQLPVTWSDDIFVRQWEKWLWNIAFNGPTALLDVTVGDLLRREEQRILVCSLMDEVMSLAPKFGVKLPEDLPQKTMDYTQKELSQVVTSMVIDRRRGQALEWDIFYGALEDMGSKKGLATPAASLMASVLQVLSAKARENAIG